ncbi:MAG: hypothetical protein LBG60_04215 [Bifidobacteriaceae bacterium]|nr:hypothetical protein [Bifidobacteriaceae bacterium]
MKGRSGRVEGAAGSGRIVKLGIVTADAAATANAYRSIFPTAPAPPEPPIPPFSARPHRCYRGEPAGKIPLRVEHVFTENLWFEIIEPVGDAPSPWKDHLDRHGASVCFASVETFDGFEDRAEAMNQAGFATLYVEEKGFERYAYFDTASTTGLLVEIKDKSPRAESENPSD